jgi:hypothetical protein
MIDILRAQSGSLVLSVPSQHPRRAHVSNRRPNICWIQFIGCFDHIQMLHRWVRDNLDVVSIHKNIFIILKHIRLWKYSDINIWISNWRFKSYIPYRIVEHCSPRCTAQFQSIQRTHNFDGSTLPGQKLRVSNKPRFLMTRSVKISIPNVTSQYIKVVRRYYTRTNWILLRLTRTLEYAILVSASLSGPSCHQISCGRSLPFLKSKVSRPARVSHTCRGVSLLS